MPFLANDAADSVARTTRLAKYGAAPGGSDYYWAFKSAVERIFVENMSFDEAVGATMSNMTVSHQRRDNQKTLSRVYQWKLARPGFALSPPSGSVSGPRGELVIKLEPAFALEYRGIKTAYVPWTFKDLRITSNVAGMGIHLLQTGLSEAAKQGWRFCLMDVLTEECFTRTHKHTAAAVHSAIEAQENALVALARTRVA